jgi:putative transcriptional regulator
MGIVINKGKAGLLISDLLDQIGIDGHVRVADTPVLNGGPVDIDRGFVLHSADYFKPETSLKISETLSLTSTKDVLEALVSDDAPSRAVLAVGYAGWGAGQLEAEIADNAWLIAEADEALIFNQDLDGKWATALSEMGIDPSALAHGGGRA